MKTEFECRFYNINKDEVRAKLKQLGAKMIYPEFMQKRTTFRCPDNLSLSYGRVRQESDCITMSLKRLSNKDSITGVKEECVRVDSYENAVGFMQAAGMAPKAYIETMRELWKIDDTEITIDTWPGLKPILEIEGSDENSVAKMVALIGFNMQDALFGFVDTIAEKELGIPADEINNAPVITFENPLKSRK